MSASCEFFVFHTTQRCHSVFSCFVPLASFHERLVARENVATRFPPVVERTSGSLPRFPINVTLFKLRLMYSSWGGTRVPHPLAEDKHRTANSFLLHNIQHATSRNVSL